MIPTLLVIAAVIAYGRGDHEGANVLLQVALVLAVVRLRPTSVENLWREAYTDAKRENDGRIEL